MTNNLHSSLKPSSSLSASSHFFNSKILLLLTLLPLSLALFAFVLQWRGEIQDPTTRWTPKDRLEFPGMDISSDHVTRTDKPNCADLLGQSRSASFPYFRDWKFNYTSDLKPKVLFFLILLTMIISLIMYMYVLMNLCFFNY